MLVRYAVKLIKLLCRTAPATLVRAVVGIKVGLVPYLPIFDIHVIAVCPALCIMADDMLTHHRPFVKIFGRVCAALFLVLDGCTQPEKGLCARSGRRRLDLL